MQWPDLECHSSDEKKECAMKYFHSRETQSTTNLGEKSVWDLDLQSRSQVCSASLHTSLCLIKNNNKNLWKCSRKETSPSNILFLQRISLIKTRKELPKQGNLGAFFKRFFKIIITTLLASTNIACSFSSSSPGRLVRVHSVPAEEFFFLIFVFHTSYSSQ